MQNIRYKLIPLSDLQPHVQTELDAEIRFHLEALTSKGKDYEKAQEMALQRVGCEVVFDGDVATICKRVDKPVRLSPPAKKRNVQSLRPGVTRRVA